jgi:signal transduction histidine kinase/DNA-binding response OmpR family regulator
MKWFLISIAILVQAFKVFSQQVDSSKTKEHSSEESIELIAKIDDLYKKGKESFENGDNVTALPYFLQIDSLSQKHNLINETTVRAILDRSEISRVTFTHAGVELAKDLKLEALAMAERIQSDEMINTAYVHLADIFGMVDDLPKSKYYTDKAFEYFINTEEIEEITQLYLIYMNYYFAIEDLDSAEIKLIEGINYIKDKDHPKQLAKLKVFLGNYWEKYRNNSEKAIPLYEASRSIYQQLKDTVHLHYLYVLEGLGNCHAKLNNYKGAFEYYQLAYEAGKEHEKKKNTLLTRNLETRYQSEQQQKEIELLTLKNSLTENEKANQRVVLFAIIIVFLIVAGVFYVLYKSRQKVTNKLRQLNEMKSVFFANISHEFRTPLTLIKTPIEMQLAANDISQIHKMQLHSIKRHTEWLLNLVDQLLDLSKLEASNQGLNVNLIKPESWFNACAESFQYAADQKDITFTSLLDFHVKEVYLDPDVVQKVISNLMTNAIKYTKQGGHITFEAKTNAEQLSIIVKNDGEIIAPKNHAKVFERFYQLNPQHTGVGIGLSLVKELVELHLGTISLATTETQNIFTVVIPISENFYDKSEIIRKPLYELPFFGRERIELQDQTLNYKKDSYFVDKEETEKREIILVVEDNDDIRSLIKQQFESDYRVKEASNGLEGIKKAKSIVPDIIISDLMMPEIDGIELIKQLKCDEITSHIPIILLTAKAGEENELIGLENEADDYILKPFSSKKLSLRVKNLIGSRKKLREKYNQQLVLKPQELTLGNPDKVFLQKVQKLLDEKLTSNEFTAEYFSKEIGMSRMQLHRKLKALIGLNTTEFIRSQRLKLAFDLIKNGQDNISEVAYAVGFNDPSYFSKCFKDTYQRSPAEYVTLNN